ncbi:MAG TPA: SRPBCC domain-containing protein [Longimicrobium sp.]|nr:SRPBCC domain-containing protein [Longimicrobium sp.]
MPEADAKAGREIGDEAVREATGRTWDEWEALLDSRGAADLSHKGIVAILSDGLIESGWWAQNVANHYEKRKGKRALGQTADGAYQVGVRRTLPLAHDAAWRLVTSPEGVRAWLGDVSGFEMEKGAAYTAADGAGGEVRVAQPGSHLRLTWRPRGWAKPSTIQVRVLPAGERTTISFHEERLPGAAEREARRRHFEAALDALQRLAGIDP